MNTKYLFLDIDGTLVGFNGVMPPSALEALKKAQAALAGIPVAFKGGTV